MTTLSPPLHPAARPALLRAAQRGRPLRADQRLAAVVAAVLVVTTLVVATLVGVTVGPSAAAPAPVPVVTVVVAPGDTVLDLARQHGPAGVDPLLYSVAITRHNRVDARAIRPGTVLELPAP